MVRYDNNYAKNRAKLMYAVMSGTERQTIKQLCSKNNIPYAARGMYICVSEQGANKLKKLRPKWNFRKLKIVSHYE